jgi:hypothetical protein
LSKKDPTGFFSPLFGSVSIVRSVSDATDPATMDTARNTAERVSAVFAVTTIDPSAGV